jgi:hypothetical protein
MIETTTETAETVKHSAKRQTAAVVASTTVAVVLGIAANVIIGKLSARVQNKIAPQPESE